MAIGLSIPFNPVRNVRGAIERAARERRKLQRNEAASALYENVPVLQRALECYLVQESTADDTEGAVEVTKITKAMKVLCVFDRAHQKLGGN